MRPYRGRGPGADPHTDREEDGLIFLLRDIGHLMRRQHEGKASQQHILILLARMPGITQRDLTERLGIQPGSMSEILTKLENAGLIARSPNAADRRTTDLTLTERGQALAEQAMEQRQARHREMFACLDEAEKAQLRALLEKLRTSWEARLRAGDRKEG